MGNVMEDKVIHDRYKELACAVIAQGINDWLHYDQNEYSLYKWMRKCPFFDYLGIDREYVYAKVLKLKEKGYKSLRFYNYGKDYNIRPVSEESGEYESE